MAGFFRRAGKRAAAGGLKRAWAAALCLGLLLAAPAPAAHAAQSAPDAAQQYIDRAPADFSDFLSDPLGTLWGLLAEGLRPIWADALRSGGQLLLFLVLCAAVLQLMPGSGWRPLLEWIAAGGSFLLLAPALTALAERVAAQSVLWRDFLVGYIPVFASVSAAAGEVSAAAVYNGFFLACLYAAAEVLRCFLLPAAECYLAAAAASIFSGSEALADACTGAGKLLQRLVTWAGMAFTGILGLQRVFAAATDAAGWKLGRTVLQGVVPLVSGAVAAAAATVWTGLRTLQIGLGFAALVLLGLQFLPVYGAVLAQLILLQGCGLAAHLLELSRCGALFRCLAAGLSALAALLALFFGMVLVGTMLMLAFGNGG